MAYKQDLSTKHMGSYERFCVDDACAIAQFLLDRYEIADARRAAVVIVVLIDLFGWGSHQAPA